jgi:hypothetical protein
MVQRRRNLWVEKVNASKLDYVHMKFFVEF